MLGGSDIFFHVSEWQGDPAEIHQGRRVTFDISVDKFKPGKECAKQVRLVDGE